MKLHSIIGGAALSIAGALSATASQAANLVANGSFENGLDGWAVTQGLVIVGDWYGATDGAHAAGLGGDDYPGPYFVLEQSIVGLEIGKSYQVSFDWKPYGLGNAQSSLFSAVAWSGILGSISLNSTGSTLTAEFTHYAASFVATAPGITLRFADTSDTSFQADQVLDNVVLASVPEPGAYAFMVAGLAFVGAAVRRLRPGAPC